MSLSQVSFWFFILWIVGCGCVATGIAFVYVALMTAFMAVIFLFVGMFNKRKIFFWYAGISLCMLCGAGYALWYQARANVTTQIPTYNQEQIIQGEVISSPHNTQSMQSFLLRTDTGAIVSMQVSQVYAIQYADVISMFSSIQPLDEKTKYLERDGVVGTVSFARVESVLPPQKFSLFRFLYSVRDKVSDELTRIFSKDQASLASGLLLGQQSASFSAELKNDMKQSGTTHLVALSGYNIAIVIQVLYTLLAFIFSRKKSFTVMIVGVILFVLMTGAESSVVRAAIMGSMVLVAQRLSRVYDFSHAMAFAAWVMILFNPLSFVFDIGFALSFVSLWGLAYIAPIFMQLFKKIPHIPLWLTKTFSQTLGAQLAVAPLLLYWFGGLSVSGIITNVILLPLVPYAMGLSFVVVLCGLLVTPFGWFLGIIVSPLLSFFIGVIHLGARFGFTQSTMSLWMVIVVYIMMVWVGVGYKKKHKEEFLTPT